MIHTSDLFAYERCAHLAWNKQHNKQPYQPFYDMPVSFRSLWKTYLHLEDSVSGNVGDSNEISLSLLENHDVVCDLRLEYKDCRTRIPVLQKIEGGYLAIYPFLSAFPKENEACKMKIDRMIAASLGIEIIRNQIVYINKDYIRQEQLDVDQLFCRSHLFFNRRNHLMNSIDTCIEEQEIDLDTWILNTKNWIEQEELEEPLRTRKCTSTRRCMYYGSCFDDSKLPDDSILFLTTSHAKYAAFEKGIVHIKDLPLDELEGFRLQYAQYRASQLNAPYYDHWALKHWLSHIQYPISYLDFEWDTFAVPPYNNMKPFDVLCFQYSLHIEREDEPLYHTDFFGVKDCREAFIQSLIKDIPKEGTILVYNMEGAEKLRLQQLAEQFPQYKEQLDAICARMIDLSKPFESGIYYSNVMRGHYSLKTVLPAFTDDYSYQQLQIKDGMKAVHAYRTFEETDEKEKIEIREDLRRYCKMDTFAEYVVYHGLKNLYRKDL